MQAAGPGKEENPFLMDDGGLDMQPQAPQAMQQTMHHTPQHQPQQFAGDGQNKVVKPARPPARPPPPHANGSKVTSSPAKSAFDDLNDSIKMAFSGSPSKQSSSSIEWATGGFAGGQQNQTGTSQQSAFAHQQMFSSPAKNPVMDIGGVCPNRFHFLLNISFRYFWFSFLLGFSQVSTISYVLFVFLYLTLSRPGVHLLFKFLNFSIQAFEHFSYDFQSLKNQKV